MRASSNKTGIGQPVRRREDFRLLTGKGCYSDDFSFPGEAYAMMVRSPHAHALIRAVDTAAAAVAPGVLAVLTGQALGGDGLQAIPHWAGTRPPADIPFVKKAGPPPFIPPHFPMTAHEARHCGEIVAMVVATTIAGAKDGAELVDVDYEPLPVVIHSMVAVQSGAPLARGDATSNPSIDAEIGDPAATNAAFSEAAHVVKFETWEQRIAGVPMEPRAATGTYDPDTGRYTLYAGIGGAVRPKQDLAKILGVVEDKGRGVIDEVG